MALVHIMYVNVLKAAFKLGCPYTFGHIVYKPEKQLNPPFLETGTTLSDNVKPKTMVHIRS